MGSASARSLNCRAIMVTSRSPPPQIYPNGDLAGGPEALKNAVTWCGQEERRIRNICLEARGASTDRAWARGEYSQILQLGKAIKSLRIYMAGLKKQNVVDPATLQLPEWNLKQISQRSCSLWLEHFRQMIHTPGIAENASIYFE